MLLKISPYSTQVKEKSDTIPLSSIDMKQVLTLILGGGQGSRLFPLTETRCKPAVNFGGVYRLIDIPVSNAINSGCHKIYIITQFLSSSLHKHIFQTYHMDSFRDGFIEVLAAEQTPTNKKWYQGTADAVRQNLAYYAKQPCEYFLILSGDQLYHINFQEMLAFAKYSDADLVIGAVSVNKDEAQRMGVMKLDESSLVTDFFEKPQTQEDLNCFKAPESLGGNWIASMGIYLFKRKTLLSLLDQDLRDDFGKHLIPTQVALGKTYAFLHHDYWKDIGTIRSFFEENIALTFPNPQFSCYREDNPIFTNHDHLPAPKITNAMIEDSIISNGSYVKAFLIKNSILGPRSVVDDETVLRNCYLMGNDSYSPLIKEENSPDFYRIGKKCLITNAIIDKNVFIHDGVQLVNRNNLQTYDSDLLYVRDGIIVVPRDKIIPQGFVF